MPEQWVDTLWFRREMMPQLQTQVPNPLADNLPALLPIGGMRTPAIWVLFLILIRERQLKRATMEIERHHIGSGERILG